MELSLGALLWSIIVIQTSAGQFGDSQTTLSSATVDFDGDVKTIEASYTATARNLMRESRSKADSSAAEVAVDGEIALLDDELVANGGSMMRKEGSDDMSEYFHGRAKQPTLKKRPTTLEAALVEKSKLAPPPTSTSPPTSPPSPPSGSTSTSPPTSQPSPPSGSAFTVKVVSYNLFWWKAFGQDKSRGRRIVANIKDTLRPDVMGAQECDDKWKIANDAGLQVASDFNGAQGTFVKTGFASVLDKGHANIHATGKWGTRYVTWAKLSMNGRIFFHFNTHWCVHSEGNRICNENVRYTGAKHMMNKINELTNNLNTPAIITGDFNAFGRRRVGSQRRRVAAEKGPNYFLENGFEIAEETYVDAIFYSKAHWTVGHKFVGKDAGSDHEPIVADLTLLNVALSSTTPTTSPTTPTPPPTSSPAPPTDCTGSGQDPYKTGTFVKCCEGLEQENKNWDNKGRWYYKCVDSSSNNPPTDCTGSGQDPYKTGRFVKCCEGLEKENKNWDDKGRWYYKCVDSSSNPTAPPSPSVSGKSCDEQWDNNACSGQFGNQECYTCGQRIEYLKRKGTSDTSAKQRIADEFFHECGGCGTNSGDTQFSEEGYSLVWQDGFDGHGAVDGSKWKLVHSGGGFGNNEKQFYTNRQANAFVQDGALTIRAKYEHYGGHQYTSAKLESKQSWKYGKFLVRARLKRGVARGTWAANWMMPKESKYGRWPRSGEIDIMEHVGYDTGKIHGTVHTQAYHHSVGTQIGGSTSTDVRQWHTYMAEWRPDIILFGIDEDVYQIFRKESDTNTEVWPFKEKFFLILNLAVGGNWGGQKGIDENAFRGDGQEMEIDWVKVYQKDWN